MPTTSPPRPPRAAHPQPDAASLLHEVTAGLRETAEQIVPWLLDAMPPAYFTDTAPATRLLHLRAIVAARASDQPLALTLQGRQGLEWTFLHDHDRTGLLADLLGQLPAGRRLRSAECYSARGGGLVLDVFRFHASGERAHSAPDLRPADRSRLDRVQGTDDVAVGVGPQDAAGHRQICVLAGNADARDLFERVARRLSAWSVDVRQAWVDVVDQPDGSWVAVVRLLVRADGPGAPDEASGPEPASLASPPPQRRGALHGSPVRRVSVGGVRRKGVGKATGRSSSLTPSG